MMMMQSVVTIFTASAMLLMLLMIVTPNVVEARGGRVCSILRDNLPDTLTCDECDVSYKARTGFNAVIGCSVKNPICFPIADGYEMCASIGFSGNYYRKRESSVTTLSGTFAELSFESPAANVTVTIPEQSLKIALTHEAPIQISAPINFASCTVEFGGDSCLCEVCKNDEGVGDGFKLDCTAVTLVEVPLFNGTSYVITIPPLNEGNCISIGI